jgi:hypothetical protein
VSMSKPITLKAWLRTESGRLYLVISTIFTVCFSAFQALKLFGIEKIPLPAIPATDQGWLTVNYAIQVAFIGYVAFFTAYKFSRIKSSDRCFENERNIWQNLELHDPSTLSSETVDEDKADDETAWIRFKQGANKVVKQFAWFWVLAWFSWLLHYLYLLSQGLGWLPSNAAARNFLNNLNSLMFVFLFMTLTVSTSKYGALFWSKLVCSIVTLGVVEFFAYRLSGGNETIALAFTTVSGLFASVALASFIGSIDSKFINVPVWLIPALYSYAAIQALYVFFEFGGVPSSAPAFVNKTRIMVTVLAFILKAVLFITVTWILRTGRLVYFMIEESSLNFKRDKNFEGFLDNIRIEETQLT